MRKYALLLVAAFAAISCSQDKNQDLVLSGKIENDNSGLITLVGTEYEKDVILDEDGGFSTELELPYNGYYNAIFGRIPLALYLEKDKNLNLQLDLQDFENSLEFSDDLGAENNFLTERRKITAIDLKELYEQDPVDFIASIDELHEKAARALSDSKIENQDFLESQKKELLYQKASFLNTYENAHTYLTETEEVSLPADFYHSLNSVNMADTLEYRLSDAYRVMTQGYLLRKVDEAADTQNSNDALEYIALVNETYPEGYAKNQLLSDAVGYSLKPDKYLDEVYALYMDNQTDPDLRQNMEENYLILSKLTPGKKSPEFDYENFKGGTTSLESLRGKYVYIDVWATWCGPCLREIPYLKEVEKKYGDINVEFVAISIDEAKDYNKWKEMVEEKELVGVHLYSGGDAWQTDFTQAYNIKGIPRFILIDPEGNIFDADTYRPSDPKLRELFDEIL